MERDARRALRERALAMRRAGASYAEISAALQVPKSTLSGWMRDASVTARQRERIDVMRAAAATRRGLALRARRDRADREMRAMAAAEIGDLSGRELLIAGVVAYWAEGSKSKPWSRGQRVEFVNSDPSMIRLFLTWLRSLGIGTEHLTFRVQIHETADVVAALRFWAELAGVDPSTFGKTTIKRHDPRTRRRNLNEGYRGCLTIKVRKSTTLYRRIAGWYEGIVEQLGPGVAAARQPLELSGAGSNPAGPADPSEEQATLFERPTPYRAREAVA